METNESGTGLPAPPHPGQSGWEFSELQKRPDVVLSLLEPDQLVAAKEHMPFGLRRLSRATRLQLWALRIYVLVMLVIVALSIYRALQAAP